MIPTVDPGVGGPLRDLPLAPARQRALLAELLRRGGLTVGEAARLTGASGATVRRDFGVLARRGLATRVHGGIVGPWLSAVPQREKIQGIRS
jgi:DeoR/GlpR family transcriptional regulator of sugar metabolism